MAHPANPKGTHPRSAYLRADLSLDVAFIEARALNRAQSNHDFQLSRAKHSEPQSFAKILADKRADEYERARQEQSLFRMIEKDAA